MHSANEEVVVSPRDLTRRLIDQQGNAYFVSIPPDVNAEHIEDVLLCLHQGIVKLQGYKLATEKEYRLADGEETDGRGFTFHKKVAVFDQFPGLDPKDFSDAVKDALDRAREQKINRAVVTTWEGKPIKKDTKGVYIDWAVNCHACGKEIKGRRPISFSDGFPTRAQMFVADDPKVTQYKPGSKARLCAGCSVTSLTPEEAGIKVPDQPPAIELVKPDREPVVEPVGAPQAGLQAAANIQLSPLEVDQLLQMSSYDSNVPPEYLKGLLHGILLAKK